MGLQHSAGGAQSGNPGASVLSQQNLNSIVSSPIITLRVLFGPGLCLGWPLPLDEKLKP
jgi:hypothetical protein